MMDQKFIDQLMTIGILEYKEQETLWQMAKRCAKTTGLPLATATAIIGAKAGTVVLPVVGTISGVTAGALAGLASGTFSCTMANWTLKEELRRLAKTNQD